MRCYYCRAEIGWVRRLFDRQYCCPQHRALGRIRSARALRDAGDFDLDSDWTVTVAPVQQRKNPAGNSAAIAALACVVTLVLLWVVPADKEPAAQAPAEYALSGGQQSSSWRQRWLPSQPAVRLRDEFHRGFRSWVAEDAQGSEWSIRNGILRPGKLRLWTPSLNLSDYDFEFEGQIEKRAMSWTFRAADHANYYATKIALTTQGPMPRAEIVRYVTQGGHSGMSVHLPLPLTVQAATVYQVKVHIKGDLFTTSVNGQVVDTWTDGRLKRGGVGFFCDKGESADIRWASVSTLEPTLFERLFASSLLITPSLLSAL